MFKNRNIKKLKKELLDTQLDEINMDNTKALLSLMNKTRYLHNEIIIDLDQLKDDTKGKNLFKTLESVLQDTQEFQNIQQVKEQDFLQQRFTSIKESILKVECGVQTHSRGKGLDWAADIIMMDGLTKHIDDGLNKDWKQFLHWSMPNSLKQIKNIAQRIDEKNLSLQNLTAFMKLQLFQTKVETFYRSGELVIVVKGKMNMPKHVNDFLHDQRDESLAQVVRVTCTEIQVEPLKKKLREPPDKGHRHKK